MRELFIDIETFSPLNLAKTGVYPYADHDDFELLLFGYSIDGSPVEVVDLTSGEELPEEVLHGLVDPGVVKWAFNAAFERVCLSHWLARARPPESGHRGDVYAARSSVADACCSKVSGAWSLHQVCSRFVLYRVHHANTRLRHSSASGKTFAFRRTSRLSVALNDSARALSALVPTVPMDCCTPNWRHVF